MLSLSCAIALAFAQAPAERILADFSGADALDRVHVQDVTLSPLPEGGVRMVTGHDYRWPGISLTPPGEAWNLSEYARIEVRARNAGPDAVSLSCRVDNPGGDGATNSWTTRTTIAAGKVGVIVAPLTRSLPETLADGLYGMRGYPGGLAKDGGIDPEFVTRIIVFTTREEGDTDTTRVVDILSARAVGAAPRHDWLNLPSDEFHPFIDRYGQFAHADWPGKVHSDADLADRLREEDGDLAAFPAPTDRNEYGGWKEGPRLRATGLFRVEKVDERWWLVDPRGRLFWSHGVDCVRSTTGYTPITDREHYFAELPDEDSPFAEFYGIGSWGPHGYYAGKTYRHYGLGEANLLRKYGADWRGTFAARSHDRLRSWGLNTVANWSDPSVYRLRRTPYVATLNTGGRVLEGSEGFWRKFPDPFDDGFAESMAKQMEGEAGNSAGDPWCIGYFVDNELSWGDETALAVAALSSPADQPAKVTLVERLRAGYADITALNRTWGTDHGSWDALLQSRDAPPTETARDEMTALTALIAERYFSVIRDAVKAVAPGQLYLGCRFAWANPVAVEAAARYCDVVSYNLYRRDVRDFAPPGDLDVPIVVGEFHFGALDRGMFHTGLQATANQDARAQAYRDYVNGALANPRIVGTHWFQYADQATTGRGDGENYQIGFLDIADTPYPETIRAVRDVGYAMYRTRFGGGSTRYRARVRALTPCGPGRSVSPGRSRPQAERTVSGRLRPSVSTSGDPPPVRTRR